MVTVSDAVSQTIGVVKATPNRANARRVFRCRRDEAGETAGPEALVRWARRVTGRRSTSAAVSWPTNAGMPRPWQPGGSSEKSRRWQQPVDPVRPVLPVFPVLQVHPVRPSTDESGRCVGVCVCVCVLSRPEASERALVESLNRIPIPSDMNLSSPGRLLVHAAVRVGARCTLCGCDDNCDCRNADKNGFSARCPRLPTRR
ncbi:unnamed protein product [Protopolystoma xenopodis]|uniref:Uncharacterized protein n=1 Tax=Protopolystoma xenopodis TaxID=117903 RepID=A0A3S4ZYR0_9PLAT|nr:unnamed protein product [Protopolystoma xenopodis]